MNRWSAFFQKIDPEDVVHFALQLVLSAISLGVIHVPGADAQLVSIAAQALLGGAHQIGSAMNPPTPVPTVTTVTTVPTAVPPAP